MNNEYIFVLDTKGLRVTSFLIGLHADTEESCMQLAQTLYPNHTYLVGTQEMQNEFVSNNKCYINGNFIDYIPEPVAPTKAILSPFFTLNEIFLSTSRLPSYEKLTFLNSTSPREIL